MIVGSKPFHKRNLAVAAAGEGLLVMELEIVALGAASAVLVRVSAPRGVRAT
jgi:hypothetical protein